MTDTPALRLRNMHAYFSHLMATTAAARPLSASIEGDDLAACLAGADALDREAALAQQIAAVTSERDRLGAEHEAVWRYIESAWDIEPRAYFEKEAPRNGFNYALCQAAHHTWKRHPKVESLRARLQQLEGALDNIEAEIAAWREVEIREEGQTSASANVLRVVLNTIKAERAALAPTAPDETREDRWPRRRNVDIPLER